MTNPQLQDGELTAMLQRIIDLDERTREARFAYAESIEHIEAEQRRLLLEAIARATVVQPPRLPSDEALEEFLQAMRELLEG